MKSTNTLFLRVSAWLLALYTVFALAVPAAADSAAGAETYLEEAPVTLSDFTSDPVGAIRKMLDHAAIEPVRRTLRGFCRVLLFLLLSAAVVMLVPGDGPKPLLEMIAAGGSFLLLSDTMLSMIQDVVSASHAWRDFLAGFVPVFASVTAAGGQITSAAAYSGFFLMTVSALAEAIRCFLLPAARLYMAVCAAGIFTSSSTLSGACVSCGKFLQRLAGLAGMAFSALLGFQRVFSAAADNAALRAGKAVLSGTVPIVGQALASAADTVSAAVHTLQAGLGFAALAILGADFLPLYLRIMAGWAFLAFCGFFARILGLNTSADLFSCLSAGLEVIAAVLALFFGMMAVSTLLMIGIGNGG